MSSENPVYPTFAFRSFRLSRTIDIFPLLCLLIVVGSLLTDMCGIFVSISTQQHVRPSHAALEHLQLRGPDYNKEIQRQITLPGTITKEIKFPEIHAIKLTAISTVLSLRSDSLVAQPLEDKASGSFLCWNGEAWKIADQEFPGNDGERVFGSLLDAIDVATAETIRPEVSQRAVIAFIATIAGPFAFVFYDASNQRIYYGRDALGRRSLLVKNTGNGDLVVSSICDVSDSQAWLEIEANGIYMINLTTYLTSTQHASTVGLEGETYVPTHFPWINMNDHDNLSNPLISPFPLLNKQTMDVPCPILNHRSAAVATLSEQLTKSLSIRIRNIPLPPVLSGNTTRIAILFSGGLDCTMLARLSHDVLPLDQDIDLLNVAFENPRVVIAAIRGSTTVTQETSTVQSACALCPDRITGLLSHAELQKTCLGRKWRFVSIDIPYAETLAHRGKVISLMHPHKTEMDLSIAYALYFAARGSGIVCDSFTDRVISYTTPARVLISGLGADELFAGYTRHANAFRRRGQSGLVEELELDFGRLGSRNLGRDDRVTSHWGKEVRYPYLDEKLVSTALSSPIWWKCGFGQPELPIDSTLLRLEPGKLILRLLAWEHGMKGVSMEKKRAIQFGARTAKMDAGKSKGTQTLA